MRKLSFVTVLAILLTSGIANAANCPGYINGEISWPEALAFINDDAGGLATTAAKDDRQLWFKALLAMRNARSSIEDMRRANINSQRIIAEFGISSQQGNYATDDSQWRLENMSESAERKRAAVDEWLGWMKGQGYDEAVGKLIQHTIAVYIGDGPVDYIIGLDFWILYQLAQHERQTECPIIETAHRHVLN